MPTKTVTLQILADAGDTQSKLDEIAAKADEIDRVDARIRVSADDADAKAKLDADIAAIDKLNAKSARITILADAAKAQASLDDIVARADALDLKTVSMKFRLDDADGKEKLDEIRANADELGLKDVRIKVRVDGLARATAELTALRGEEDKVNQGGILNRLIGMAGGGGEGGGGGGGILSTLIGPAGLAIVPAIEGALVEVTGLVSGFAAAGAGAGAFALLAVPAIDKVKNAYSGLSAAQSAYKTAVQTEKLDPTTSNASAVKSAAAALTIAKQQFDALPKSEQSAATGVQSLVSEFGKLSTAFEPQAFTVFENLLKVANNLLPTITPFANTFATSIDGMLKNLDKFTALPAKMPSTKHIFGKLTPSDMEQMKPPPTGWQTFLASLHSIEGPALTAIGNGIGKVAGAIGNLLTKMSGKDVAHAINIAFDLIAGGINITAGAIQRLMNNWDRMSSAFRRTRHDVASAGHDIAHAFDSARHGIASSGHGTASDFDDVRHGAATAAHDVAHAFDNVRGGIASAFKDVGHGTASAFDDVRHNAATAGHDVAHAFDNVRGGIAGALKDVGHGTASAFDDVRHGAATAGHDVAHSFDNVRGAFATALSIAGSAVSSGIGHIVSFLEGLPGKIKGVFADAGSWLLSAGKSIIEGLIRGIGSMAGDVVGAVEHIGSSILGHISSFLGISSPSKKMITIGAATIQGLIIGLQGGQSAVNAAVTAIGNTVAGPDSTITAAITKLRGYVPKGDTGLNKWLTSQNSKLQALASRRNVLEAEIQQSEQVAQSAIQGASIMNAPGIATADPSAAPAPVTTSQVISGMQSQVTQLKQFQQQIAELKKMGLNATSLSQIVQAGPSQGLGLAQAITSGGKQAVAQLNSLQSQIKASASKLGDSAGPAMYQAGVDAAQGLAAGLKSQLASVDAAISQLAQSIVNTIKKALKSHSPSLVMAEIGLSIPQGVAMGIDQGAHLAAGASSRLAASTVQPWSGGRGGMSPGGGDHFELHFHGVQTDPTGAARQIVQVLKQYKRQGGGGALGIA